MAKLHKIGTEILWRMEKKTLMEAGTESITRYALRSDGVLLSQLIVELHDGRHNYGWKIATKKPRAKVRDILASNGYVNA